MRLTTTFFIFWSSASLASTISDDLINSYGVGSSYAIGQLSTNDTRFTSGPFSRQQDVNIVEGVSTNIGDLNQNRTSSFGNSVQGRLTFGGPVGAAVETAPEAGATYGTSSFSTYFDILSFGDFAPSSATYTVSLDAVLSSLSSGQGESEATVGVNLLDISDFSGQILERSATGQIFITDAAYGDYSGLQIGDLRSIVRDTATSISGPGYEEFVNNDGTEFAIDRSITGNFNVAANKDYLLLFSIGAIYTGEGVGKSDALNTGVFSFSAGQSLDLTSASGSTYSAVAPVPLPAGFSLLVAGLIGLGALARRKKHA